MTVRLTYIVSHPIQYQAPLLQEIARQEDLDLTVLFEKDFSTGAYFDRGFSTQVKWDVPLTDGYPHHLLNSLRAGQIIAESDAIWMHGWQSSAFRSLLKQFSAMGTPVLMRGENWSGAMPDGFGPIGWLKRRYLNSIFKHCSAFLAVGSANRIYYEDHGVAPEKIFPMPYAVDNDYFAGRDTPEGRSAFRSQLGIPADQPIILFAGKLTRRKQPDELLEAWRLAFGGMPSPPALVFAGDGECRETLERGALEHVYFTGFKNQSELPAIYGAADIFVLASRREPWGLAINEAMACGAAVIASSECGASYDLIDPACGRVVQPGRVPELTAALSEMLPKAGEMGAAARQKVETWDFNADVDGLRSALDYVL